jgi:hypothetical protein
MLWRTIFRILKLLTLIVLFLVAITPEWPAFGDEEHQLNALVGLRQHDFLLWEIEAVTAKGKAILGNGHSYLPETERKQFVLDYLDLIRRISEVERAINAIYVDPNVPDPDTASQELQAELAQKRAKLAEIKPTAEAIVQDQVGDVLVEEGFSLLEQAWPPVFMHMSPLPFVMMVSPRDRIERKYQVVLVNGLPLADQDVLENAVYDELNFSALVQPIGGLGTYPSMIQETSNINWLIEVTAHEWAHNWFGLSPVSLAYGSDPTVRTVNETAVSIIDQEIAAIVIERYYPEFVPPPPPEPTDAVPAEAAAPAAAPEPPAFDFRAEMYETRIQVDTLLAAGKIEAAETYMEARRRFFVEHGYNIRKLNQAYFAFYGAYAASPGGATGEDPIGPMLRDIRAHSSSIRDFLERVAPIGSFADLERVHQEAVIGEP